jgi:predicted secreted protein
MVLQRRWLGLPLVSILMAACSDRHDPAGASPSAGATAGHAPVAATTVPIAISESPPGLHRVDAFGATAVLDVGPDAAPLDLKVGQLLRIHLPASPATGYDWVLEQGPLPLLSLEVVPGLGPTRLLDRTGVVHSWVFRAERAGHARLRFAYRRSWDAKPARFSEFDVTVR